LITKLKARLDKIQNSNPEVEDWSHIETILFCISELASVLTKEQVGAFSEII